jgi:hypothetical protein
MGSGDAVVHLDIEQVLRADRSAILLRHPICEAAQRQSARLAGMFDDIA